MAAGGALLAGDVPREAEGWKSSGGSKPLWRKKTKEKRRGNDLRSEMKRREGLWGIAAMGLEGWVAEVRGDGRAHGLALMVDLIALKSKPLASI